MPINVATVNGALNAATTIFAIIESATKTLSALRTIAAENGATPEQLAAMDKRLSDAISRREHEVKPA